MANRNCILLSGDVNSQPKVIDGACTFSIWCKDNDNPKDRPFGVEVVVEGLPLRDACQTLQPGDKVFLEGALRYKEDTYAAYIKAFKVERISSRPREPNFD